MQAGTLNRTHLTVVALALLALTTPAAAQELRSEKRAREQAEKTVVPNVSSTGERVFEWLEDYLTSSNKWYVTVGNLMPSSGLAPGLGYRGMLGESARFNVRGAWSIRNYSLAEGTLSKPLAGDKLEITGHAAWRDGKSLPSYGVGSDSVKEDRTDFALRTVDVGATATARPTGWIRLTGGASAMSFKNGADAAGVSINPDYLHAQGTAAIDTRESEGYTRSGGYYALTFHDYTDRGDSQSSFRQIEADVRQFIPILNEHWVIALRGYATTTDAGAGDQVPFFMMPSLGGSTTLRGYPDGRFRDRNALLVSAEYRWIPGRMLDMAVFVDAGKVEASRQDLNFEDLSTSVGIGAQFHAPAATVLRLEAAHGREGLRLHCAFGKSF